MAYPNCCFVFGFGLLCRHLANPPITSGTHTIDAQQWGGPQNPGAVAFPRWTFGHTHTQKGQKKRNRTKHTSIDTQHVWIAHGTRRNKAWEGEIRNTHEFLCYLMYWNLSSEWWMSLMFFLVYEQGFIHLHVVHLFWLIMFFWFFLWLEGEMHTNVNRPKWTWYVCILRKYRYARILSICFRTLVTLYLAQSHCNEGLVCLFVCLLLYNKKILTSHPALGSK